MRRLLLFLVFCPSLFAEDQSIREEAAKLQAIPPKSPSDSLKAMELQNGFRAELVASEPSIHDPVAVDFDENGRMFVVQLPRYNAYAVKDFQPQGSIAVLEDADNDGHYERSSLFASGLSYPTAIACWDGGVLVGDAPDLLYLKDTDGDDQADVKRVILTGFGRDKAGEAHLNSFRWGFDNRFHFSTNLSGGDVRAVQAKKSKAVSVRSRGILLDPRDMSQFERTSGGGQHGMSMDDFGRKFVCANSVPAQTLIYDDRYLARNPHLAAPNAAVNIAPDGKFTKLYRISPPEPWRALRTKLRSSGRFRGSDEGGKPFGFFTGATGITIYRGDAWPPEYRGNLIVGDVANNLIYRAKLEPDGVGVVARRDSQAKFPKAEFLASRDIWFRPVQFANAPDGSLFVLDMHRALIEGAAFLPPEFLPFLNVMGGHDRGRIYRIVPPGFQHRAAPKLGKASTAELVALLEHPNGWHRDTASRLLYQRQDKTAAAGLRKLARESASPVGRATALHSLNGLGMLGEPDVLRALEDPDPKVRIQAVRLAEAFAADSAEVRAFLIAMTSTEKQPSVRYQLAFSLGGFRSSRRNQALAKLAIEEAANPWLRLAIQSSLADGAEQVLQTLLRHKTFRQTTHGKQFLTSLTQQISAADRGYEIAAVIRELNAILGKKHLNLNLRARNKEQKFHLEVREGKGTVVVRPRSTG